MLRLSTISALALATAMLAPAAFAATTTTPAADPILATVNGQAIHMSDVQSAAGSLPAQMQQLPAEQLFPLLVNQQIDRKSLLIAAKAEKLERNPGVAAVMAQAANEKLEDAYVQQQVSPVVTDAAIQAEYDKDYANKPGPEQVDARHILVQTKAQAEDIIDQLNKGADFATLATKDSIDPGAKNGGELGWFSKDQMVPAFSTAAFALKKGEYTKTPVQTQFGYHIILNEGERTAPTPALADVKDQIRSKLADAAIQATLAQARSKVKIVIFNADGTPNTTPDAGAPAAPAAGTPAAPAQ